MDDKNSSVQAAEDHMPEQDGRDRGSDSGKGNWKKNKKFRNNKKDHFRNKKDAGDSEYDNDLNNTKSPLWPHIRLTLFRKEGSSKSWSR